MTTVRPANARGNADFGWLHSRHTFSFGQYFDPDHMGFGPLRVINEDLVQGGGGFPPHGHRDMEILSWVIDGGLEHKDSIGSGSVIRPGEVQVMSAGTGIRHSEYNASDATPVRFLQIWIEPDGTGHAPTYQQEAVDVTDRVTAIASPEGGDGAVTLHQDVTVRAARAATRPLSHTHDVQAGRGAWIQLVDGEAVVNGTALGAGDGFSTDEAGELRIEAAAGTEFLLFDLPMGRAA